MELPLVIQKFSVPVPAVLLLRNHTLYILCNFPVSSTHRLRLPVLSLYYIPFQKASGYTDVHKKSAVHEVSGRMPAHSAHLVLPVLGLPVLFAVLGILQSSFSRFYRILKAAFLFSQHASESFHVYTHPESHQSHLMQPGVPHHTRQSHLHP